MTADQIAHVIKKRTSYKVTRKNNKVVVWLDSWHGAIVIPGHIPTIRATIPETRLMVWYVIVVTITCSLIELFWRNPNEKTMVIENELRELFRCELGVMTR